MPPRHLTITKHKHKGHRTTPARPSEHLAPISHETADRIISGPSADPSQAREAVYSTTIAVLSAPASRCLRIAWYSAEKYHLSRDSLSGNSTRTTRV